MNSEVPLVDLDPIGFAHRLVAELAKQEPVAWWTGVDVGEDEEDFMTERLRKAHETASSTTPRDYPIALYSAPVIPAGWVMVSEDAVQQIDDWAKAYHEDIFPEMSPREWEIARSSLTGAHVTNGEHISLDRISASNMRYVITKVKAMLSAAPKGEEK